MGVIYGLYGCYMGVIQGLYRQLIIREAGRKDWLLA